MLLLAWLGRLETFETGGLAAGRGVLVVFGGAIVFVSSIGGVEIFRRIERIGGAGI